MLSSSLTLLHQHAGTKSPSSLSQEPAGTAGGTVGTRSLAPRPSTRGGPCQGRRKEQVTCTSVCYKSLQMVCVSFPMLCCYVGELLPVNIHKANLVAFTQPLFTCFDPTMACSCATKLVHPTDQHFLVPVLYHPGTSPTPSNSDNQLLVPKTSQLRTWIWKHCTKPVHLSFPVLRLN